MIIFIIFKFYKMKNKKILITGGSGFIGTNLVNYLNKKKYILHNVDKVSYCSTKEKFKIIKNKKYFFHKLNIGNKIRIENLLKKHHFDLIINLASESHVDKSIDSPYYFINENISSTTSFYSSIFNLVKKKKIFSPKIIHISTDEVFGSLKNDNAKENYLFNPASPYSASKACTEHIAKIFLKTYGLKISIIRLCNNYGPYQFTEKFIPNTIVKSMNNLFVPVYGNGKNIREWMHVNDTCRAIEKVIKNFKNGENFNIGSGIRVNNIKIIKILEKNLNKKINIKFVKDRPAHDLRYSMNSNKFRLNYRWKCKYDLISGLKDTLNWYTKNLIWLKDTYKSYTGERLGKL